MNYQPEEPLRENYRQPKNKISQFLQSEHMRDMFPEHNDRSTMGGYAYPEPTGSRNNCTLLGCLLHLHIEPMLILDRHIVFIKAEVDLLAASEIIELNL